MAYIGRGIENLLNTQKLDAITPSTSTGAGPYNLTQNSTAFVPASADSLVISIDGVIQYGNFTVSGSTVTFNAALSDSNTCDFIYQMGTGLLTTPTDGSVNTAQLADDAVTTAKILNANVTTVKVADDAITNAKIANESITINGSAVALGGSVTIGETKPTISSISPTVIENTQTSITITGTNFVNGANVEAVATNGAIVQADTVTFNSATSISAAFTISTDGTYFLRIENPDGNAVRSSSALLTVSDAPAWTTSAGSLGTNAAGSSVSYTVAATGATSFALQSGSLPGGVSLNTSTGVISGTESGATAETTYNFTIRATDAEAQTADRAFSITISVGINNSGQFN
tara:strand:+ start:246 stop:1283 length:1038 start_codon:yes stop_codon:yes gene_type:complete